MPIGCAGHISGTIAAITSTNIIHVRGAPLSPGSPSHTPPQVPRFKGPVPCGSASLSWRLPLGARTTGHKNPSPLSFPPPPKPHLLPGVLRRVRGGKGGVLARDPATRQPRASLHGDRAGRERSAEPRRPRARSRLCNATRSAEPGSGPDPS